MATGSTVQIIVNPAAGRKAGGEIAEALESRLRAEGWTCRVDATEGDGDARRFAEESRSHGAEVIVVVGGDGTLFEVAAGLAAVEDGSPVLLVPAGSTNAVARAFALPDDPEEVQALLAAGSPVDLDAGEIAGSERRFLLMATVGYPARVATDAGRDLKNRMGFLAYVWAATSNLFRLRTADLTLETDDRSHRYRRVGGVIVANIGSLADPKLRLIPGSDPRDGQLEVLVVGARSTWDWLRLALRALVGKVSDDDVVHLHRARSVTVRASSPLPTQCDGEPLGETPLEVTVRPAALRLILPPQEVSSPGETA